MATQESIDRLVTAAESIAHTVALTEKDIRDSRRVGDILTIWDDWYRSREHGEMRPPEVVLDEIGEILYRTDKPT